MKYIRTKDKIVEVKNEFEYVVGGIVADDVFFADSEIITEADTIEELCDEFVWNIKGSNKRTVANNIFSFSRIKIDLDKQFHGDYEIYGAIWTDEGLIYVAKMNDKGELELL